MNDAQLLDALARANEYPSHEQLPDSLVGPATALADLDRRIAGSSRGVHRHRSPSSGRRGGWLIAVAVFAAVMAAGAALVLFTSSRQLEPASTTTTIPLVGVEDSKAEGDAFELVEAAYANHSRGDGRAWFEALFPPEFRDGAAMWADVAATNSVAGETFHDVRCVSHGFGDWPGISADEQFPVEGAVTTGYRFECSLDETNTFHDAAGIVVSQVHNWVVADGAVVAAIVEGDFEQANSFNQDFRNWLLNNHYDVFARYETFPWLFPRQSSIAVALAYVNEFVDDSPDWPRRSSN